MWTASARSLTNFGSGALAPGNTAQTTLAGSTAVDLRTSAGIFGIAQFCIGTGVGATASMNSSLFDGTNAILIVQTAAAASVAASSSTVNNNSVGLRLFNNDATHAGFYMVAQINFTQ